MAGRRDTSMHGGENGRMNSGWKVARRGRAALVAIVIGLGSVVALGTSAALGATHHFDGVVTPTSCSDYLPGGTVVGMASSSPATTDETGYWIANSTGLVASCGFAPNFGVIGFPLVHPIVGIAARADGLGYWLVASDGGIFAYGDAQFYGSTGGIALNKPIVGMASDAATGGYWFVASDGGIFSFGAPFHGSATAPPGSSPPPPASPSCAAIPLDPNPPQDTDVTVDVTSNVPDALVIAT